MLKEFEDGWSRTAKTSWGSPSPNLFQGGLVERKHELRVRGSGWEAVGHVVTDLLQL